jgi:hypothetical protein
MTLASSGLQAGDWVLRPSAGNPEAGAAVSLSGSGD